MWRFWRLHRQSVPPLPPSWFKADWWTGSWLLLGQISNVAQKVHPNWTPLTTKRVGTQGKKAWARRARKMGSFQQHPAPKNHNWYLEALNTSECWRNKGNATYDLVTSVDWIWWFKSVETGGRYYWSIHWRYEETWSSNNSWIGWYFLNRAKLIWVSGSSDNFALGEVLGIYI